MKILNIKFKVILKLIFLFFFILLSIGIIQATDYDSKYVNRQIIQIDFNNIRTPLIKRLFLKIERFCNLILYKKTNDLLLKNNDSLTRYKYIPSKLENIINQNNLNLESIDEKWFRSNKNNFSQRFSSLQKINDTNVDELEIAWVYRSNDGVGQIQSNPIIVNNKIITPTPGHNIVAIDSKTGQEVWKFKSKSSYPAQRGLVFWEGNDNSDPGIFFSDNTGLYKLNAKDGKLDLNFGKDGFIKTKLSKTAPLIVNENLIISTFAPSVDVYDVNNGKIKWKFFLREDQQKIYINSFNKLSGCNPWGGISADTEKNIVYITTGNAQPDYFGLRRPGKNKYCNSILAIDLKTKKKIFDFQEIEHDVWNRDMASPPILGNVKTSKGIIDIVIAMSKTGNILVLDRINGNSIFDIKLRLGEGKLTKNKYFLDLEKPEPVEKFELLSSDIVDNIQFDKKKSKKINNKRFGFYIEPSHEYDLLTWTGYGGIPWTGGSFDDENDILYVNSNKVPGIIRLNSRGEEKYELEPLLLEGGYPATHPPWGSLNAIDLRSGKIKWKVPLGEYVELTKKSIPITGTENYGGALATKGNVVFASGSLDKKIRAFSSNSGKVLWEYQLPHQSFVAPSTYVRDNEQYLIVIATGGGVLQEKYPKLVTSGDYFIAFKLKSNK